MPNAYLIVTGTPTDADDGEVPGVYLVEVADAAPPELVEETALEAFHLKIGISELDDFSIRVVDSKGQDFQGQTSDPEARDKHPLESWGTFMGGLNDADVPFDIPAEPAAPGA